MARRARVTWAPATRRPEVDPKARSRFTFDLPSITHHLHTTPHNTTSLSHTLTPPTSLNHYVHRSPQVRRVRSHLPISSPHTSSSIPPSPSPSRSKLTSFSSFPSIPFCPLTSDPRSDLPPTHSAKQHDSNQPRPDTDPVVSEGGDDYKPTTAQGAEPTEEAVGGSATVGEREFLIPTLPSAISIGVSSRVGADRPF